jgi:hypothetical protein
MSTDECSMKVVHAVISMPVIFGSFTTLVSLVKEHANVKI